MRVFLCILNLLLFVTPVFAQDRFDQIDTNKDGYISWEEFQTAMPNLTKAAFDAINTSKNGKISREEWDRFQSSHGGMMHMGGGSGIDSDMKMEPGNVGGKQHMPSGSHMMQQSPHTGGNNGSQYIDKPLVMPPSKK